MDISYSNNTIADWIHYVADQRSKWQSEMDRLDAKNRSTNSEDYQVALRCHDYFFGAEREFRKMLDPDFFLHYEDDIISDWMYFYYGSLQAANEILNISKFDESYSFEYNTN